MATKRIRILCDIDNETASIKDSLTDEPPFFVIGDDVDFEIGITRSGSIETLQASADVYLEVKATESGSALFTETEETPTTSFTVAQWDAGTHQHTTLSLTAAETALLTNKAYWLHVYALDGAEKVTAFLGLITVRGNGTAAATETSYTKAEADARYARNRFDITALTGGSATDLDGQPTANGVVTTNSVWLFIVGSTLQMWRIRSGSDAEDGSFIIRPDDYNVSTNQRVWERII